MEPAGLAIGIPGIVGLLIKTSLEGYRVLSTARDFNDDFDYYQHQFDMQHHKLREWAVTLKESIGNCGNLAAYFNPDEERYELVVRTLARITQLFVDTRRLKDVYGVQPKESSFRRYSRRLGFSKRDDRTAPAPAAPPTLNDLDLDIDLSFDDVERLAPAFNSTISSYAKLKWAFSDKDKLQALIDRLERYNKDLRVLTANNVSTGT